MINKNKGFKLIIYILVIVLTAFSMSYFHSKSVARRYLKIMNAYSSQEDYLEIKKDLYDISTDRVKAIIFDKESYNGPYYNKIDYKIDRTNCFEIKGFRHFVYEVEFTVKDWNTVQSLVYVKNGIVYDTHRKD